MLVNKCIVGVQVVALGYLQMLVKKCIVGVQPVAPEFFDEFVVYNYYLVYLPLLMG